MAKFLFVTELDQTLVGKPQALLQLNTVLGQHRDQQGTQIVYMTGRSQLSYLQLQAEHNLLPPDALIAAVGTELYIGNSPHPLLAWAERMQQNWDRDRVLAVAANVSDLSLQPPSEQGPYKVSYILDTPTGAAGLANLQSQLQAAGLGAQVTLSRDQYVDILPSRGDKGQALQFLRQTWQISAFRTVLCGTSGTDIAAFASGGERGIIIGQTSELAQWHRSQPVRHHYLAQDDCAAGIWEGLHHFRFLP